MENNFRIGDVVCLNSNPEVPMTVHSTEGAEIVIVAYLLENNELRLETLHKGVLTLLCTAEEQREKNQERCLYLV